MKDTVVLAMLVLSFATLLTTHLVIALRLSLRARPRYRGLLALLVPPLAPFFAWGQHWRRLAALWVGAVVSYAVLVVVASL